VALCLIVASELSKLKVRNVNFIVVLFDQEEDGEVGSLAYTKMLNKKELDIHSVLDPRGVPSVPIISSLYSIQ